MTEARGRAGPGRRPASPQGPAMHTARGGGDCPPGPCLLSRQCPNDTLAALWVFQPWASLGITVTGVRPPSLALAQMPPSHNSSLLLPLKCRLAHAVGPPAHTMGPPAHTVGPSTHGGTPSTRGGTPSTRSGTPSTDVPLRPKASPNGPSAQRVARRERRRRGTQKRHRGRLPATFFFFFKLT